MEYREIEDILNCDVVSVTGSTKKEKEIFSNQKEGGFFTFDLKSGQRLVGHFTEEGKGLRKKRILTFRPLNHVIKGLKEVSYIDPCSVLGDMFLGGQKEEFKFEEGLSDKDKEAFADILAFGHPAAMDEHPQSPIFLERALKISKAYFRLQSALNVNKKRGVTFIKNTLTKSR